MPRFPFFTSLGRVHQWNVNLFYRGVSPKEIENMGYQRQKYWNSCHEILRKEEKDVAEAIKEGR
jgi:hypothetical protein